MNLLLVYNGECPLINECCLFTFAFVLRYDFSELLILQDGSVVQPGEAVRSAVGSIEFAFAE